MQIKEGEFRWSDSAIEPANTSPAPARSVGPSKRALPAITLAGVTIHRIDEQTCNEHILRELATGRGGFVVTPNLDHLRRCQRDVSFSVLVAEADLVVADGMPLVWASHLQGTPLPQRVAGSDLISSLSAAAAEQGRSIFLLGGADGTADLAAQVLTTRYPKLKVVGTLCPRIGFENDDVSIRKIIATLQQAAPDIVYVALGSPKQEQVIERIRRAMPQTWWLGVGVSFSFLCGDVKRAPQWMRKWGLEWIHRLYQEPRRLFKRYVVVGIPFAAKLLCVSGLRGIRNRLFRSGGEAQTSTYDDVQEILKAQETTYRSPSAAAAPSVDDIANRLAASAPTSAYEAESGHANDTPRPGSASSGKLRGLILLGGAVRPTPLGLALGRSVLDMPVGNNNTVLTRWLDEAAEVAQMLGMDHLPVRLLLDRNAIEPTSAARRSAELGHSLTDSYRMERDISEFRGTGGLLANIAVDYDDEDMILVGNAAQVLLDPLPALLTSLNKGRGTVGLVGHRDGEPSGLMLITCRALRLIPKIGFVDMKEQALPIIASTYDVHVVQCRRPTGLSIRTLSDYIAAVRAIHLPSRAIATDPWAEDWKSTFAIVEPGAVVAPSARIHDSVVLAGATVEAGAAVVRSVVAGTVRRDRNAVDVCVEATGKPEFSASDLRKRA